MRTIVRTTVLALALASFGLLASRSASADDHGLHVVQAGETLYSIAATYGVSAEEIAAANGIMNPDYIRAGQTLAIPGGAMHGPDGPGPWDVEANRWGGGGYIVKPGDTLYSIAWRTGTSVSAIMAANGIANPNVIYAGQSLILPGGWQPGPGGPWPDWSGPDHGKPQPQCGYRTTVKNGDSLSAIAWRTGSTINALARANGIAYPYLIYPGQQLHVPCAGGHNDGPHRPGPRPTARPTSTGLVPAACNRNIQIVEPLNLAHVSGTLYIVGTADIPNLQFYKIEYARGTSPLASEFHSIGEVIRQHVRDGLLGVWYLGNMPAGDYVLRLTAVDTAGQFPTPCSVRLKVN